jgi:hypothetical protein
MYACREGGIRPYAPRHGKVGIAGRRQHHLAAHLARQAAKDRAVSSLASPPLRRRVPGPLYGWIWFSLVRHAAAAQTRQATARVAACLPPAAATKMLRAEPPGTRGPASAPRRPATAPLCAATTVSTSRRGRAAACWAGPGSLAVRLLESSVSAVALPDRWIASSTVPCMCLSAAFSFSRVTCPLLF